MQSILILDDEIDNLDALKRSLRGSYSITTTHSPFEGLKLIQKNQYAVIISDQRMPEMTGVEFLEKAKHTTPLATRILLTGYTDIEAVIAAINQGNVYRYIAKPWDPDDLKLTLKQATEAYELKAEIEAKNRALNKSNTELKKALHSLTLLDRAKARFLSLISHELNTPLTVLSSFTQLLDQNKSSLPEEIQKSVSGISEAGNQFKEIIAEVILYVKLESSHQFQEQKVDLAKELKSIAELLSEKFNEKNLKIAVSSPASIQVLGDPVYLNVAFRKLIEDAIKQSNKDSEIRLTLTHEGDNIRCALWRNGTTLTQRAFSPLEPAGKDLLHQRDLGLGLAICKNITEGHGGKISLDFSRQQGTQISVLLPSA